METLRLDIISIGTLSRNLLWKESETLRTAHATTTLIRSGKRHIVVDPGLPPPALAARLFERTGLKPQQIDTVFLTNSKPAHRAGLSLFPHATVLIHELERKWALEQLRAMIEQAPEEDIDRAYMQREAKQIEQFKDAPDELMDNIDLFPLFGYTPGTCGLLLTPVMSTIVIAGDAVPTQDHFMAGQVLQDSMNIEQAQESMREVYEIADLLVPGHDNLFVNPRGQGM